MQKLNYHASVSSEGIFRVCSHAHGTAPSQTFRAQVASIPPRARYPRLGTAGARHPHSHQSSLPPNATGTALGCSTCQALHPSGRPHVQCSNSGTSPSSAVRDGLAPLPSAPHLPQACRAHPPRGLSHLPSPAPCENAGVSLPPGDPSRATVSSKHPTGSPRVLACRFLPNHPFSREAFVIPFRPLSSITSFCIFLVTQHVVALS